MGDSKKNNKVNSPKSTASFITRAASKNLKTINNSKKLTPAKKTEKIEKKIFSTRITRSKQVEPRVLVEKLNSIEIGSKKLAPAKKTEKIEEETFSTRITRSKKVEPRVLVEKLNSIQSPKKLAPAKKPEKIEKETFSTRTTRSKVTKPNITVQQVAPTVEPAKKSVVKRTDLVKSETIEKNALVLAKQKYSCAWPARILEVKKDKVFVYFFGDKRTGFVDKSEIYDFVKSFEALKLLISSKKKPRGFITGLREIELLLGLNDSQSIVNSV